METAKKVITLLITLLMIFVLGSTCFAFVEDADTEDVSGSQDHPLISRFPGSYIRFYESKNYDEFNIPLSYLDTDDIAEKYGDGELSLEGKLTKNLYVASDEHSTLEIFRNYEMALNEAGFEIIARQEGNISDSFSRRLYGRTNFKDAEETKFEGISPRGDSARYLTAKLSREEGDVYLSLFVAKHSFYGGRWPDGLPVVFQVVVEETEMETSLIEANRDFESLPKEEIAFADNLPAEDISESQDHPLFSRIPGSYIRFYESKNYDEFNIPLSYLDTEEVAAEYQEDELRIEGQLTKNLYVAPDNYSTLEIFKNYEIAAEKAGFEIIARQEGNISDSFSRRLYERTHFKDSAETGFEGISPQGDSARYLTAKLSGEEGDVYLSLFVAKHSFYGGSWPDGLPVVFQVVVEETDLRSDLISVEGVLRDIQSTGRAAIQGIYFEHDSDRIQEESTPTIEKIAELLERNPELELYVVGHTDNTGSLDYNMNLSRDRAEALVERLVSAYNIDSDRLNPAGVGPLTPAAANETEAGRAENRRVELVKSN